MSEFVVANTLNGSIKGVKKTTELGDDYFSFQRVPYAKPPINELRFSDPQPSDPWPDFIDGTIETPSCIQLSSIFNSIVGDEDCLYLNIYTKNMNPEAKTPVMVYIHGGGFMFGSCGTAKHGPDYILQKNIILVTINYRVGVLGFASFSDPSIGIPGNAGLRDQLLAVKWIKKNIEYFGGDADNITLCGQSAGANSVYYMMLSENAKGLFKRSIVMSGTAITSSGLKSKNNYTLRLAEIMGWTGKSDERGALEFLRQQNARNLIMAQERLITDKERLELILFPFGPIIEPYTTENSVIPKDQILMTDSSWSKDIDMIIGGTSDEGLIIYRSLKSQPEILKQTNLVEMVLPSDLVMGKSEEKRKEVASKIKQFYIGTDSLSLDNCCGFVKLMTDKLYLHRIYRSLSLRNNSNGNGKTYFYRFSVDSPTNNLFKLSTCGKNVKGCSHADDVSYMFKNVMSNVPSRDSMEFRTMQTLVGVLTKFATDGNPNEADAAIIWEPINGQNKPFKCFNIVEEGVSFEDYPEGSRMQFWDSLYTK